MKNEEFMADFILVSQRTLDPTQYKIFKYHFLLGADFNLCCRKMKMDRGTFFHEVYRIEQTLGRTFRELQPYALFPLDEYFGGSGNNKAPETVVTPFPVKTEEAPKLKPILKFPVKRAA